MMSLKHFEHKTAGMGSFIPQQFGFLWHIPLFDMYTWVASLISVVPVLLRLPVPDLLILASFLALLSKMLCLVGAVGTTYFRPKHPQHSCPTITISIPRATPGANSIHNGSASFAISVVMEDPNRRSLRNSTVLKLERHKLQDGVASIVQVPC